MSDEGIRAREKVERQIELQLQKTYTEAQKDILKKLDGFISKHKEKEKAMRRKLDDGEISNEDYQYWLARQVFIGAQWEEKVREITNRLTDIRGDDLKMIHDREIGVFADNANYQAYKMEHDIGKSFRFDIYDERTVRNLVENKPALLPEKIVDRKKHNYWNQGIIANCITQGIVQGESIPKIARRIANATANRNLTASTLYARTAMTCAQNAGRMERLRESKEMGINVKKQWLATHDSRTRDSHIHLDGQIREVEKPFDSDFGKIDFPGDPHADPADVYNCRCTVVYIYPDYEELDQFEDNTEAEQMSFDEWMKETFGKDKEDNNDEQEEAQTEEVQTEEEHTKIAEGKDISGTWRRRTDEFETDINDIMNAQGFDGLPQIVSKEEFDKAVAESNFIAQRTYSAKDQETLDMYRDMLYNGEWYVDCTEGGAQYGKGMYCAADYNGQLTSGIKTEMQHYIDLNKERTMNDAFRSTLKDVDIDTIRSEIKGLKLTEEQFEAWKYIQSYGGYMNAPDTPETKKMFNISLDISKADDDKLYKWYDKEEKKFSKTYTGYSYTETITLTPDAKIITFEDAKRMTIDFKNNYVSNQMAKEIVKLPEEEQIIWARETRTQVEGFDPLETIKFANELKDQYGNEKYSEIVEKANKKQEEIQKVYESDCKGLDVGSVMTMLGYDAINAEGHGQSGSYTVILNRTKCIFLGGK